jgi:predicted PolB exonuclease-like 3'-5' exonuclease
MPYPPTSILVFDIETVADTAAARRIYPQLTDLNDVDALERRQRYVHKRLGTILCSLPPRIVCISALHVMQVVVALTDKSTAKRILSPVKFFRAFSDIENLPLISWNGSGFDIPVLITVPCSMTFQHRYYLKKASKNMRFDNYV